MKQLTIQTTPVGAAGRARLFTACYDKAQAIAGAGWQLLGPKLQRGLVATEILHVLADQDDSINPETIRTLVNDMHGWLMEQFA